MKNKIIFTWKEYVSIFAVFSILGALPAILYGVNFMMYFFPYGIWYIIYWLVVSLLITLLIGQRKKVTFEEPMQMLKDASRKVASGDFSVYLKPLVSLDPTNYINEMFKDFNKMVEELGSLETMKTDFIANVSHEIKTPLASIQGYAKILQDDKLSDSERKEYTSALIRSTQNLSRLATNILQLSKLENQGILSSRESYNVCEQLSETIGSFINLWDAKKIKYNIELEDYATLYADPSIVDIIWRNLLSNATKFTNEGGEITIQQTSTSKSICVSITDNGIGMSEETAKRLFEKFYQGDTSRSVEGNGLGMSLVARSIELLNGQIEVVSKQNQGTTFKVTIDTEF